MVRPRLLPMLAAGVAALAAFGGEVAPAPAAKIARHNGEPAVFIGGEPCAPMSMLVMDAWNPKPDAEQKAYWRRLADAGARVFYVTCATAWHQPADEGKGWPDGTDCAIAGIRRLLDAVPEAWIMLRLNVSPSAEWVEAHPEEMVTYDDGSHRPTICDTISGKPIGGMLSLCSEKWREEGATALEDFFRRLDASAVSGRVVGTFLCAGGTSEWYYPIGMTTPEGRYCDFSEPFRREYERFLRAKYGTVENLRRAWRRPDASFEKPLVPTPDDQFFAEKSDAAILEALHSWESSPRMMGGGDSGDGAGGANAGVFLDMDGHAHVKDFYDAWHEGTANTIIHFARVLKRICPARLVGAFYGSCGSTDYFNLSTATGTLRILDSGAVDFLAAPGTYNNREPGGIVAQREMQDSFRMRGLIYVCEDDSRTHLCKPWMQRDAMALYTARDSVDTLKRDFARNICEGLNGWWFDMGNGWYDDPEILALFRRQREIADLAYSLDRTKRNEIAVICDTDSMHAVSKATSTLVLDYWRTSDIGRIGAGVDWYFHDDMADPRMPDYKLYVMANVYCLTDKERGAIYAKARRNGATVLWMYAPGFVDEGAERRMSPENVSKTVGMDVSMAGHTVFPHFRILPEALDALKGASASRRYGVIDADIHSNIWMERPLVPPAFLNPAFFVDDPGATVLGRYCSDGRAALAEKDIGGVKSLFCAAQVMQWDLLAAVAERAGCHIYSRNGDVLYANENFVAVHAGDDGPRTIRFKRRCSPYELYEQRFHGHGVDRIDVEMRAGQTLMWRVDE